MRKLRYVIWDWNGTLYNDVDWCIHVMNSMLLERGIEPLIDKKTYQEIFGFPVVDYYQKAGLSFDKEPFDLLAGIFIERYHSDSRLCALYPEVRSVLGEIRNREIKQVILSATKSEHLDHQMSPFAITGYFEDIVGLDDIYANSKVAAGLQWIREKRIEPAGVIVIGDTIHDYEVATELGCSCILVTNGHQGRQTLSGCHCEIVDSISDVLDYIE